MKLILQLSFLSLAACGFAVQAQPRGPNGPCAAASAASAPYAGCGGPLGHRWNSDNTTGWSMMTPQERLAHRERMSGFTRHEECKAYLEQHHALMVDRAKARGLAAPPQARRDACAPLKPKAKP